MMAGDEHCLVPRLAVLPMPERRQPIHDAQRGSDDAQRPPSGVESWHVVVLQNPIAELQRSRWKLKEDIRVWVREVTPITRQHKTERRQRGQEILSSL